MRQLTNKELINELREDANAILAGLNNRATYEDYMEYLKILDDILAILVLLYADIRESLTTEQLVEINNKVESIFGQ